MRVFIRVLRIFSIITLFFFCWTYMPLYAAVAYAATPQVQKSGAASKKPVQPAQGQRLEEKFEHALEEIHKNVTKAGEKTEKGEDALAEIETIKAKKAEIESVDADFKKEFAATEKKLKNANLPKEILDRHYKFVKHYEDNLTELKTNLSAIEKPSAKSHELRAALQKAKAHLEKVKPPKKHVPLDPNKLLNRMVKGKERAPRLKKEDFEKDFPPQRHQGTKTAGEMRNADFGLRNVVAAGFSLRGKIAKQKPILVAANGPLTGLLSSNPEPVALPFTDNGFSSGVNPDATSYLTPNSELSTPNYQVAQAMVTPPTADDLSETPEVQFTPELRKIAALLENNPVQLYEFVRNNFTYDPYYGSVKGSQSTLLLQSGNDFDQVSVLIALFRVSGIPARYAYGTVEIPIEKMMKWLGGVSDPKTAGTILATNGIPAKLIITGGAIKSVQLEHTWIEVYIPYANYRGLINDPAATKTWIPLDPSFKLTEPNPNAIDLADSQQFDIDNYFTSYLQTVKLTTPAKDYLTTTINYVTNNIPGQRFYDLLASGPIIDKVLGLLPDTLPYPIKTAGAKFSTVPENYRHRVTLDFTDPGSNETILTYTASWATLLHNRFTISYTPATTTDEQTITNYGDIYFTPPYLIKVKPLLKVEGVTVAEGSAVSMAEDLTCKMSFIGPQGALDNVITNNLTVGATHAIGLGSGYTTGRIITYRTTKFEAAATAGESGDSILGEYLNLLAMNYLQELDSSRKLISKSMKILDTYRTTELMVGVDLGVSRIFNIPKVVDIKGLLIDVDYNISTPVDMDGNQIKVRRFQVLAGMTGSALEHTMFETIIGVEAVSSIKALQVASVQGIPIYRIDSSNISTILPMIQISNDVKADIQNMVNAEKVVTVSERNIQLNNWNGVGYIVMDRTTGAGAYLIAGGMSGGSLTTKIDKLQKLIDTQQLTVDEAAGAIREFRRNNWFRSPTNDVDVTSDWGANRCRRLNNGQNVCRNHNGVDIAVPIGTTVYAVAKGQATSHNNPGGYGNYVLIDHGIGVYTLYAHLTSVLTTGQVDDITRIALSGNTGESSGPHLHFSIFITDSAHPLRNANGTFNFSASVNPRDFGWTFYSDGPPQ